MRLDKYLKVSRLIKRRTVANEACDNERVCIRLGQRELQVEVLSVQENAGKADAAAMYREISPDKPS